MSWTPERIDDLTKLWESGHSASAIGKILGVSKNAVVGKAHRMKLKARPSPIKRGEEENGGAASNDASGGRQNRNGARTVRSGGKPIGGAGGAAGSEPLQTVVSAALAAKAAGPIAGSDAAVKSAGLNGQEASRAASPVKGGAASAKAASRAVANAKSTVKAVAGGKGAAGATRAVQASQRGPKCLWPIGDPGDDDFHFCGEPALSGKPYCAEHCARAYITRSRSDSAAA